MKSKFKWIGIMVFGLMLMGIVPLYAGEEEPPPADVAYEEAMQDRKADIEEIAANRDAVMDEIVETWSVDANGWEDQFSINVIQANDSKLLALRNAESFDDVIAILDGDMSEHLGDADKDLVYTPVAPCKIVDTRDGGGGFISAGSTRNYQTYGNLGSQGGSNCSSPRGEPSAVHISVVAVNPNGKGNIKAHPYLTSYHAGLSVNFAAIGTNFANAGTVKVTRSNTYDISITALNAGAHVTVQVLGYYYRVDENDFKVKFSGSRSGSITRLIIDQPLSPCTNMTNGRVSIYAPGPGKITVNAQAEMFLSNHRFGVDDFVYIYIGYTPTECTNYNASEGYSRSAWAIGSNHPSSGSSIRFTIPVSRTRTVGSAGTYTFYLNGMRINGYYEMRFENAAMQATYYPDF